jgi:hypothetical protein
MNPSTRTVLVRLVATERFQVPFFQHEFAHSHTETSKSAGRKTFEYVGPPGDAGVDYTVRSTIWGLEMCMKHSKYEER